MPDSDALVLERLLRHSDWLSALARRLVVSTRADDLVQDTWLAALHNPPHAVRSPRAWLSRVARRLARLRDPAAEASTLARDDLPPADEVVARIEEERLLARLVVELEEPHRSVILQRFYGGLSAARIARTSGVPAATVRTRLRRALLLLRERLEREHGCDRRGWPLASLFLVRETGALATAGPGALLMGTKTTVALAVASGALCTLAVTEGILPAIEEHALETPVAVTAAPVELDGAATSDGSASDAASPDAPSARAPLAERRPLEASAGDSARSPRDLRRLLLSSARIDQVRAIELLVADGSPEAHRMLLDAFASTSDRVLQALLEEALLGCAPDVAPAVIEAYLAADDPALVGRLSGLLAGIAGARPELEALVIEHFLAALADAERFPERAGAATQGLASLGVAAADELGDFLVDRDSGPKGVGSAAALIGALPERHGDVVRATLAESLHGSLDVLGEPGLGAEERDAVLQKTGSLAWCTSLRPESEHDDLGQLLLETLLTTQDPAQAGTLAWGLQSLKGLSQGSRVEIARSLLDSLNGQSDDALRQQYLRALLSVTPEHAQEPSFSEILLLVQDARALQGADEELGRRLDALLAALRARAEDESR